MATVQLKNICKVYDGGVKAVDNVNIDIKDRQFVVLVGPSGCGKSTTLRMVAGLEDITSGELYIDGNMVNDVPPKDRDIAMVFQNYALYPHMTVYDNMAFGLKIRKFPKEEIDQRVREAAKILEIEELLDRKPKALSGGQRQRVAVGRAIVRKPKVFLFDEPLSNLDAALRGDMRMELARLHKDLDATMIYVTHDQVEAMTLADKIVVLDGGVVQQVGTPLELYNKPANLFVAGFIGAPNMNLVAGTVDAINAGELTIALGATKVRVAIEGATSLKAGDAVTLGVRPHALTADASGPLKGIVQLIEQLGNETVVRVKLAEGEEITAVLPGQSGHAVGAPITLAFDPASAHLFGTDQLRVG